VLAAGHRRQLVTRVAPAGPRTTVTPRPRAVPTTPAQDTTAASMRYLPAASERVRPLARQRPAYGTAFAPPASVLSKRWIVLRIAQRRPLPTCEVAA